MVGLRFTSNRRRSSTVLAGAVAAGAIGLALSACSADGQVDENAPVGVETSQLAVTIENKAGLALLEVDVAIVPVGGATEFKRFLTRLENGERRNIALGDFFGRDGTPFSLRVVRPKTVRVTAKDTTSKAYKVEVPWR